jgi:hypothetical protein
MIGGNRKYTFFRPVTGRNVILEETKCYALAHPIYSNVWCRKVRRSPDKRVEVQMKRSSRPLVEDAVLIVPIDLVLQQDDIALNLVTGGYYVILGVEDVSEMGQTKQCPVTRVENVTRVAG